MASVLRRTMVYLGLVDDDYDDYEHYEDQQPTVAPQRPVRSVPPEPTAEPAQLQPSSSIRTISRDQSPDAFAPSGTVTPRPAVVRPIQAMSSAKPQVVAPTSFPDAQQIGDRLKASQPVIVNLQGVDRDLSRRMVDFCSGATYALGGAMDKVARDVFLLTPSNVEVSAEERRRLQERGFRTT